jgi:hypothetical protein
MPESTKEDFDIILTEIQNNIKKEQMYFFDKDQEYAINLLKWQLEVVVKNRLIHSNKKREKADKNRDKGTGLLTTTSNPGKISGERSY